MVIQPIAHVPSDGVQAVIRQTGEDPTCLSTGAEEGILMRRQSVGLQHGTQTSFVETTIMCYERKASDARQEFPPDLIKGGRHIRVPSRQAVHLGIEATVVVRQWAYQAVIGICDLATFDEDQTDATHATSLSVCRLEVYCYKCIHLV